MATTALVTFSDFAAAVYHVGYRSSVRVKDVVKSVACAWPLQSIGLSRQDRQSKRVLGGKLYVCLSEPAEAVLTPARAPPQTRALAGVAATDAQAGNSSVIETSAPTVLSTDGQTPRRQPREAQVAAAHREKAVTDRSTSA